MTGLLCGLALLLADPQDPAPLTISTKSLISAAFADDGSSAVAVDEDGSVRRIDLKSQTISTLVEKSSATSVAISADGREIAIVKPAENRRGAVVELDTIPFGTPTVFRAAELDPQTTRVELAAKGLALFDGTRVAVWSRSEQGTWTERTTELARFAYASNITAEGNLWGFSTSLDGAYSISLTATPPYHSGHRLSNPLGAMVIAAATSPDGRLAAVGWSSGHVHLINPAAEKIRTFRPDKNPVIHLSFSRSGTAIVIDTIESTHILQLPGEQLSLRVQTKDIGVATWLDEESKTLTIIGFEGSLRRLPLPKR